VAARTALRARVPFSLVSASNPLLALLSVTGLRVLSELPIITCDSLDRWLAAQRYPRAVSQAPLGSQGPMPGQSLVPLSCHSGPDGHD
jgi:hypothetical protein